MCSLCCIYKILAIWKSESFIMLNCDYCALTGSLAAPCLWLADMSINSSQSFCHWPYACRPLTVLFKCVTSHKKEDLFFFPLSVALKITRARTHVLWREFYPPATSLYSDHFRKTSKLGWLIKPVYMIGVEIHRYKSEIRGPFTELENARILHPFNLKKYSQNCESPRVENLLKSTIFPWWANGQQGAFAEA